MTQTLDSALLNLSQGPVLVLDAAGRACQAALYVDGCYSAHRNPEMTYGQAEWLIPVVQEVAAEVGCKLTDLAAVVTTVGPGSFTGLRVGLAAAHGFGIAANCPVVGVSSLAAWAMAEVVSNPDNDKPIRVILDSRRDDAFVQDFDPSGVPLGAPKIIAVEQAKSGAEAMRLIGDMITDTPAPDLAGIFQAAQMSVHQVAPHPIYLRDADAVPMAAKAAK